MKRNPISPFSVQGEEEIELVGNSIFATPISSFMGGLRGFREKFRAKKKPHLCILIGRNVTTETQCFDNIIDADGRLKVITAGMRFAESVPAAQSNATITVPAGECWIVQRIIASYAMDANAANRVCTVPIFDGAAKAAGYALTIDNVNSTALTLTANQDGEIWLENGWAITNDNGTITRAQDMIVPSWLTAGSTIGGNYTNQQVGDFVRLRVDYRRLVLDTVGNTPGVG